MLESGEGALCASCGAPLTGRYCAACGERPVLPGEQSLRHLLVDNLREVLNLDARLYRTLAALLFEPGRLTREYMAGRRVRLLRPLQIFLIGNLVYFVVQPFTTYTGYNTPLDSQMHGQFYSEAAGTAGIVEERMQEMGIGLESYALLFDAKSEIYAKTLVLLMVPLFALVVALLQARRRRPFIEHVVFATHYFAWELLFLVSLFLLVYGPLMGLSFVALRDAGVDFAAVNAHPVGGFFLTLLTELPTVPLAIAYLSFAFRRAYGNSRWGAFLRAIACVPALLVIMIGYRFVLFWVTYATV